MTERKQWLVIELIGRFLDWEHPVGCPYQSDQNPLRLYAYLSCGKPEDGDLLDNAKWHYLNPPTTRRGFGQGALLRHCEKFAKEIEVAFGNKVQETIDFYREMDGLDGKPLSDELENRRAAHDLIFREAAESLSQAWLSASDAGDFTDANVIGLAAKFFEDWPERSLQ